MHIILDTSDKVDLINSQLSKKINTSYMTYSNILTANLTGSDVVGHLWL